MGARPDGCQHHWSQTSLRPVQTSLTGLHPLWGEVQTSQTRPLTGLGRSEQVFDSGIATRKNRGLNHERTRRSIAEDAEGTQGHAIHT